MATTIKIWEISDGALKAAEAESLAAAHVEAELETWISKNPELLGDRILILSRQRDIPGVGRLDLLGIDANGTFVIIELKRDRSSREAVAQALDYASWLDSESSDTIEAFADEFLHQPLADAFLETFQADLPDLACQNHRILIVAARLDASAERIINYLAERHGVQINAVFFKYSKLSDGKEILARSMLVADESRPVAMTQKKNPSLDYLLGVAEEHKVGPITEICREMRDTWRETCRWTYDGSFRYWAATPAGQERMVFGVNVAGKYGPPIGQLDVWIPMKSLAEVTSVTEDEIRKALTTEHPLRDAGVLDCWLRLKQPSDARHLIDRLKRWLTVKSGAATA